MAVKKILLYSYRLHVDVVVDLTELTHLLLYVEPKDTEWWADAGENNPDNLIIAEFLSQRWPNS